ncbi:MAG: glycosyl hydrolase family 28-related protein [Candidatus Fervidibacter sp.]|uniref:glycosyl hydrolase family 28-related protein n=1 Tax=Candidatus Fervidibacter sp. TaxID=3100871 RepID=UPI00404B331B
MRWIWVSVMLTISTAVGQPPQICRVQGGNTKTIWGIGFDKGQVEVYAWDAPFDENSAITALRKTPYRPLDFLPKAPPPNARKVPIIAIEPRGLVMAVEWFPHYDASGFYDALNGGHICWVRNDNGFSQPYPVRSTQPWFVYPERAHPGERIRIFGRNIAAKLIALKSRKDGKVIILRQFGSGRHPVYECWATLPEDLPPGEYDLFVHNGAGGDAGWGGPIQLVVEPKPEPLKVVLNAKDFGAKGNGVDDDTDALRKALVKAGEMGGGIVLLPPGLYPISKPLWVPFNVTLQGSGSVNSILIVLPTKPMRFDVPPEISNAMPTHFRARQQESGLGAMLWLMDKSAVTDLGLIDGLGTLQAIFASHTDCRIERCYIRQTHGTEPAITVEWGSHGFTLRDCKIESVSGGVFLVHGPHRQVYIGGNTIRNIAPGTANNLFVRSFIASVIENNLLLDGDRNFVSQLSFSSAYRSAVIGNIWHNNIPRRHNSGENMYESTHAVWHGWVVKADRKTVWVEGKPFAPDELRKRHPQLSNLIPTFALILDGRGIGQYRRIVNNTENSFTVEPEWDIVPDRTTYIMVGMAFVETLWIDNTEERTANWTGFWGNCFGNVIDGHILRDGEGLFFWAFHDSIPSPVAFNDIIGSRVIGRGNIVFLGPLVFGNTIRFCEIVEFRYKPSMHIQPVWLQGMDPNQRAGIALAPVQHRIEKLPPSAPLKAWNIIEGSHIYDGPIGIFIAPEAQFTIVRRNAITVDKDKIVNKSVTTVVQ